MAQRYDKKTRLTNVKPRFYYLGVILSSHWRFLTEEELGLVAAGIDDNLLEDDGGVIGVEGQLMDILRGIEGQGDDGLHDATGHGGIEDGIDVLLVLVQTAVEVDALRR